MTRRQFCRGSIIRVLLVALALWPALGNRPAQAAAPTNAVLPFAKEIEAHTKTDARLTFINVFPKMLGEDGQPRPEIFVADRLHMNARGYELWKGIVGPYLSP